MASPMEPTYAYNTAMREVMELARNIGRVSSPEVKASMEGLVRAIRRKIRARSGIRRGRPRRKVSVEQSQL